jgi:uncharacterized NAD(P)/FAD-binding protein YdhS
MTPTILIIGGGFSGVALTHGLAHLSWPGGVRIVLVDRSGHFGRGAAYSTDHPAHLLNVPAGRMGALAEDEGHFLTWIRAQEPHITGDAFVPRSRYGEYLEHLLDQARARTASHVAIETLHDQVTDITPDGPGRVRARLRSGAALPVDRVVLAIGNLPPRDIPGLSIEDDYCVRDPWESGALQRIRGVSSALMVGTGLTMVDAVLLLHEANPSARFVAVSRRGLLPLSHRDSPTKPGVIEPSLELQTWDGSASALLAIMRRAVRAGERDGHDWRDVLNGLRPITHELWRRMPPREQARFYRHVRPFWDTHRHRMSTRVAERMSALVTNKQLSIVAGRIAACARDGSRLAVDVQRRDGSPQRYHVDAVVNCTGPDGDLARSTDALIAGLRSRGAIVPDALGIGIETTEDGAVMDTNGEASRVLFTLGATRRPDLWESTAVPELRVQAHALARRLHASLSPDAG